MATDTLFRTLFWILLGGVLVMRVYFAIQVRRAGERLLPDKQAVKREGHGAFAFRVVAFLLLVAWLVLYGLNPSWMQALAIPLPAWLRWAGFALGLASLGLWIWTQALLGKEWSPQLQLRGEHHLVTSGPYAWVHHPLYTAMFGWGVGVVLVTANWVFVILAVVVLAGMMARVPREEQMMIEEFGEEYKSYTQRTGRFFPKWSREDTAMNKSQSSITARGAAFARALESSLPAGERVCCDPLARQMISTPFYLFCKLFAGYGEARAPGLLGFIAARTRFIDDYLQGCLAGGLEQLVILGAGLDSRAYRFEQLKERQVFEVDHPATQQGKIEKVKKILGDLPRHVVYAPIDFNQKTLHKLLDLGYDEQRQTLFIWEGVTYYLAAEAVDNTLAFVSAHSGQGSSIIFDYVYASALTAAHKRGEVARIQRYRRFTGEGLVFGIEEGKVEEFLSRRGYTHITNTASQDLKQAYFTGVHQNRPVASIYAIVHARVGPKSA